MEIGQCEMMFLTVIGFVITACIGMGVYYTIAHFWNKPRPPSNKPNLSSGIISKSLKYMKDEANNLGITKYRVISVVTCIFLFSFYAWGGIASYKNVTVVDCGKGDVAIRIPDSTKDVIVAVGLPCGCN